MQATAPTRASRRATGLATCLGGGEEQGRGGGGEQGRAGAQPVVAEMMWEMGVKGILELHAGFKNGTFFQAGKNRAPKTALLKFP